MFLPGRAGEGVKSCLGLSVCPSESFLPPGVLCTSPTGAAPRHAGHPRLPGMTLGPAGLGRGKEQVSGAPCWRGQVPSAGRVSNLWPRQRGTFHRGLEQNFPVGPRKPPRSCPQDLLSPIPYSFLEIEAFSDLDSCVCMCILRATSQRVKNWA